MVILSRAEGFQLYEMQIVNTLQGSYLMIYTGSKKKKPTCYLLSSNSLCPCIL